MRRMGMAMVLMLAPCMAFAHDSYQGLVDIYGKLCCDRFDCRPVDMCRTRYGGSGIQIGLLCVEIPWNRVLATPAPDGAHTPAGIACGSSPHLSSAA